MTLFCTLRRKDDESIEDFVKRVNSIRELLTQLKGKKPTIRYDSEEGVDCVWADFFWRGT